jgi:hypothetical protein
MLHSVVLVVANLTINYELIVTEREKQFTETGRTMMVLMIRIVHDGVSSVKLLMVLMANDFLLD